MELGELDEMIYIAHFALCIVHNENGDKGRGKKTTLQMPLTFFLNQERANSFH